jgi:hypothetical protein
MNLQQLRPNAKDLLASAMTRQEIRYQLQRMVLGFRLARVPRVTPRRAAARSHAQTVKHTQHA